MHGNLFALDAVLKDVEKQGGVDATWILGDLAAFGYAPVKTLERLLSIPDATIISGNTDRFLVTGTQPFPTPEQVITNANLFPVYTEVTRSLAWSQGVVATKCWLSWLEDLPRSVQTSLPDGTQVLLVHASPGYDDGPALYPYLTESTLRERFTGYGAELIIVGHTHWPMETHIDNVHVVNVGSVSNHFPPDLRAGWVCLDCDVNDYSLVFHRVDYDHQVVIDELERLKHPGRHYIIGHMRGQHQPGWRK